MQKVEAYHLVIIIHTANVYNGKFALSISKLGCITIFNVHELIHLIFGFILNTLTG